MRVRHTWGTSLTGRENDESPTTSQPALNLYERSFATDDSVERVKLLDKVLAYDPDFLDPRATGFPTAGDR
jgi:hypothetical protein